MKKLLTLVAVLFASATMAHAQFGIIGGINISGTTLDTQNIWNNAQNVTLYHIGVAYKWNLGMGFALQPALTYEMKGANLGSTTSVEGWKLTDLDINTKSGYLELGAGLQWGPDLIVARPFVMLQPYLGYQIVASDKSSASVLDAVTFNSDSYNKAINAAKSKLEYGVGIGVGVEFLKRLQLTLQYFKNLGNLYNNDGSLSTAEWETVKDIKSYNGVKVSLGIFF
ncbi:MAG: PorT family protein [Bacteroidales bacterium]|nr:PorT family protein [Bacteroidales bacterium]